MADVFERYEPHIFDVGITPTPFPTISKYGSVRQAELIWVSTPVANTLPVYIGKSNVAADLTVGVYEIPVGADTPLLTFNENDLYAIASAPGQKLIVFYLAGKLQ